ncbi:MAG: hypothetical protein LQ348_006816 [Seirophora lacunosa]|nr:MAG: hypothetical protein LQ348_006816 [Seirophora lacunosa]
MADRALEEALAKIRRLELSTARLESEKAELQADKAKTDIQMRRTTFLELLEQCHIHYSDRLNVESNPALATGGATTKVAEKLRPERMERWTGFTNDRHAAFLEARNLFQTQSEADQRRFSTIHGVTEMANLARRNVSCEIDTRLYHYSAVEPFVQQVLERLISVASQGEEPGEPSAARAKLGLGKAVRFENHANTLTKSEESDAKQAKPTYADQICVRHGDGGETTAVAVVELKPPHKATRDLVTAGLRPMNLAESVIKHLSGPAPSSSKEKFQRAADKFVAMIVTQTFSYMAESGISHGCIITGEIMIFLRILKEDLRTVYFYHADPVAEVADEGKLSPSFPYHCTSVAQLVSFCLIAHRTPVFDQQWRATAREGPRWLFSKHEAIDKIPMDAVDLERPESAFTPRREITKSFQGPSIGPPIPLLFKPKCNPKFLSPGRKPDNNDDPDGEYEDGSPTKERYERQSKGKQPQPDSGQGTGATHSARGTARDYAYCTQQCLKGLVDRGAMDSGCSNYEFHPQKDGKHAITRPTFARLLRQQLAEDRDDYCLDLAHQGATGRLFKLTLASHGYTLVGKGTTSDFIVDSKREGRVYHHLKARQGKTIPVYLGNIDLVLPWIGGGMDIVHMLLMSFAGQCVLRDSGSRDFRAVAQDAARFDEECVRIGALHRDTRFRNIMWNNETQSLMFIDFDRTILFDVLRPSKVVTDSNEYCTILGSWQHRVKQAHVKSLGTLQEPSTPTINSSNQGPGISSRKAHKSDFVIWSEEAEETGGVLAISSDQESWKGRNARAKRKQEQTMEPEDEKENNPTSSNGNGGTRKQETLDSKQMGEKMLDETEIPIELAF